jgi:hypothetical protein
MSHKVWIRETKVLWAVLSDKCLTSPTWESRVVPDGSPWDDQTSNSSIKAPKNMPVSFRWKHRVTELTLRSRTNLRRTTRTNKADIPKARRHSQPTTTRKKADLRTGQWLKHKGTTTGVNITNDVAEVEGCRGCSYVREGEKCVVARSRLGGALTTT